MRDDLFVCARGGQLRNTHSCCGAPVFVSIVSTKNMKMTNTASPTQKPITMESAMSGNTKKKNKMEFNHNL